MREHEILLGTGFWERRFTYVSHWRSGANNKVSEAPQGWHAYLWLTRCQLRHSSRLEMNSLGVFKFGSNYVAWKVAAVLEWDRRLSSHSRSQTARRMAVDRPRLSYPRVLDSRWVESHQSYDPRLSTP